MKEELSPCIVGVKHLMKEDRSFMTKNEERVIIMKEAANPAPLQVSLLSLLMQQSKLTHKKKLVHIFQTCHALHFTKLKNASQL